jgi:hypothetical protein
MLPALQLHDLTDHDGEPRIKDVRLADALEFNRQRDIRQLIERNCVELERYGVLRHHAANSSDPLGRGRPSEEYWLNEAQALILCMRSDAPRAADCRQEIIAVFQAWRTGKLVPTPTVTLEAIEGLFDKNLTPIKCDIRRIDGNVTYLSQRIDRIVPRNDFEKDTKSQFLMVVLKKYNRECPCCREVTILNDDGSKKDNLHFDHFAGRERNKAEDGWPVCHKCNLRLRDDAQFKTEARKHFEVFQENRRKFIKPIAKVFKSRQSKKRCPITPNLF